MALANEKIIIEIWNIPIIEIGHLPIVIVLAGIALLLILMLVLKLNSFLSLIIVSLLVGIAEGMPVKEVLFSIMNGSWGTLSSLALILGFGAILGKMVAES